MHETSATILTILAVAVTAILNRMDSKANAAKTDTFATRVDARFDTIQGDIVAMREPLTRIEERIGIKAAAS